MSAHVIIGLGGTKSSALELFGKPPQTLVLTETRKKPSTVKVTWQGITDFSILESPLLEENIFLSWIAFFDDGATVRRKSGTYIIKGFSRKYGSDNTVSITLTAIDRQVALKDKLSNKVYKDIKASDLAEIAAEEMGMESLIIESEVVYKTLSMAGETLGSVLSRLADTEDYEFFIRNNVLYFSPSEEEGDIVNLYYSTVTRDNSHLRGLRLLDFGITRDALGRVGGNKRRSSTTKKDGGVLASILDAISGNSSEASDALPPEDTSDTSLFEPTEFVQYIPGGGFKRGSVGGTGIATNTDGKDGVTETVPDKGKKHSNSRNSSQAKFIRWRGYKVSGNCWGGFLTPREFIQILGIPSSDSGPWYLDSVTTTIADNEVRTSFNGISEPKVRKSKNGNKGKGSDGKGDKESKNSGVRIDFGIFNEVIYSSGGGFTREDKVKETSASITRNSQKDKS